MREVRDHGTLRIRINQTTNQSSVVFQDDALASPRKSCPTLFDPFYTTKTARPRDWIGLKHFAKPFLREHSGNVEATSGPGGGAVFTVTCRSATGVTTPSGNNKSSVWVDAAR